MADAASCAGVDASLRADMGVAERGGSDAARARGYISHTSERYPLLVYLAVFDFSAFSACRRRTRRVPPTGYPGASVSGLSL